jgi:hypothetical protein
MEPGSSCFADLMKLGGYQERLLNSFIYTILYPQNIFIVISTQVLLDMFRMLVIIRLGQIYDWLLILVDIGMEVNFLLLRVIS